MRAAERSVIEAGTAANFPCILFLAGEGCEKKKDAPPHGSGQERPPVVAHHTDRMKNPVTPTLSLPEPRVASTPTAKLPEIE
jgi:hypothetical protein